jgi:hypothetical protein
MTVFTTWRADNIGAKFPTTKTEFRRRVKIGRALLNAGSDDPSFHPSQSEALKAVARR